MLQLYDYQQEDIVKLLPLDNAGIYHAAGCGKTIIAISLLRHKSQQYGRILKTIIFCPIITLNNWKAELMACSKLKEEQIGVVTGSSPKKKLEVINNPKHLILITNYEASRNQDILSALIGFKAELGIADESHMIKTPKQTTPSGKPTMFGAACKITEGCMHRYILTGTPVTKDAQDFWAQYYFLDRGETFGKSFWAFKNKYFVDINKNMPSQSYFPKWTFIKTKEKEFRSIIESTSVRRRKEDCVDLPDLVEQMIEVPLSLEQAKIYNDLKQRLVAYIESEPDNPLVVKNALTKLLRLNEVLSGYMKLEDETIVKLKKNPRLDALMELVEKTNPYKVIIFSVFKENYKDIRGALDKRQIKYVEIHGGISTKKKLENVDEFNDMSNDIRVCIAHPKSGGVGINMKSAAYMVSYTRDFSLVDFEQSKARNYRSGSIDVHQKITHYYLTTPGTVCEHILESLRNKKEISHNILDIKNALQ